MRVGVTNEMYLLTLGTGKDFHSTAVEASSDLRSFRCEYLDDQASRPMDS